MAKKKGLKIFLIVLAVILAIVLIIAGVLFFPLLGKAHTEVWSTGQTFDLAKINTVEKTRDDFKILVLTDTQLWMNPSDNKACYDEIRKLVEQTKPDLIATTGDNVSGVTSRFLTKQFVKELDSYKIPWTAVFGNHDDEIPMTTLNWQGDQFQKSPYSLFEKGPSNLYGCGNYVVNITEGGKPVYSLFMFDNGRYFEYEEGSKREIYMGYEQIAWYEWNVRGIAAAAGKTVPSMVFSHFALPEFREAVEAYGQKDATDESYTIPAEHGFGACDYLPGCAPVDSGFFDTCKELGSTKYLFCGHDHENYASVGYEGMTMTYGMKTGPSPAPWNNAKQTGGTLVTIRSAGESQSVNIEHIPVT